MATAPALLGLEPTPTVRLKQAHILPVWVALGPVLGPQLSREHLVGRGMGAGPVLTMR